MKDIPDPSVNIKSGQYRPLFIFIGFLVLGGALALVLFSGRITPGSQSPASSDQTLLGQVSDISQLDLNTSSNADNDGYLDVGDRARDFSLPDFDGNSVSLGDFQGKPVILNLWATWCAPCRIEMPALQEAHERYQQEGLVILALNQDEPLEVARTYFYDEMNLSFTPLQDKKNSIAADYGGLNVLPTTYFIDRQGIISAIHRGPMTIDQIEGYLAEMISDS